MIYLTATPTSFCLLEVCKLTKTISSSTVLEYVTMESTLNEFLWVSWVLARLIFQGCHPMIQYFLAGWNRLDQTSCQSWETHLISEATKQDQSGSLAWLPLQLHTGGKKRANLYGACRCTAQNKAVDHTLSQEHTQILRTLQGDRKRCSHDQCLFGTLIGS